MKDTAERDQNSAHFSTLENKQHKTQSESYRRSKMEIYLDVLSIVKNGVDRPTRIMYRANLSWKPFQETLKFMLDCGLIAGTNSEEEEEPRRSYRITDKGNEVLKYFALAKNLLEPISPRNIP